MVLSTTVRSVHDFFTGPTARSCIQNLLPVTLTLLLPCGASAAVCSTNEGAAPDDVLPAASAERQKRRNVVVPDVPAVCGADKV
jgi:hypothetical protein